MYRGLSIGFTVLWLGACGMSAAAEARAEIPRLEGAKHFVLIGASVGHAWNLPAFPTRMQLPGFSFDYVGVFEFDKSRALDALLADPSRRPDAVLLKECAAYFPGELDHQQTLIRGWIAAARRAGVLPIVVTVAPVTAPASRWEQLKAIVKTRVLGRPDQNEQIQAYNDWLRQLAAEQRLPLLDLEAALRVSESDRSLRTDLTSGDGLHLNQKGYALLDRALVELVTGVR